MHLQGNNTSSKRGLVVQGERETSYITTWLILLTLKCSPLASVARTTSGWLYLCGCLYAVKSHAVLISRSWQQLVCVLLSVTSFLEICLRTHVQDRCVSVCVLSCVYVPMYRPECLCVSCSCLPSRPCWPRCPPWPRSAICCFFWLLIQCLLSRTITVSHIPRPLTLPPLCLLYAKHS